MSAGPAAAPPPRRPSPTAAGARLGELYAANSRMVYGICRMLLRDADEAEDATQQVFLAAYRSLLAGTDVRDPAAWLGTIARNACRRHAVTRAREPVAVDDEPTLVSPAADETAIGREEAAALYAQLARLPAKQREAVVLRDVYGLRYDEVAKALGTSRPAVESLLFRGRRQIRRRLRPGVAATVLAVPVAIQESIAYAVPGFASTAAAPAGAAAAAAGVPLVAKLATAGAAVILAGSAGVAADRGLHDPPTRPASTTRSIEPVDAAAVEPATQRFLPIPAGGFPVVRPEEDDHSGPGKGGDDQARAAANDEAERHDGGDRGGNRGRGNAADAPAEREHEDNSGPGSGDVDPERASVGDDRGGPGHAADPVDDSDSGGSGSSGPATSGSSGPGATDGSGESGTDDSSSGRGSGESSAGESGGGGEGSG